MRRRRRKREEVSAGPPSREDVYLRDLAGIPEERLLTEPRPALGELSQILRRYVSETYAGAPAAGSESDFRQAVETLGLDAGERRQMISLFDRFQEYRYGAGNLSSYDLKTLRNDVIRYLEGKRVLGPAGSAVTGR